MAALAALSLAFLAASASAAPVNISNVVPRRDTDGAILDAHDGKVLRGQDGVYRWFAASYGNCTEPAGGSGCADAEPGNCGFQLDHNVTVYESTDLSTWTNKGHAFRMQDSGIPNAVLFCPKILFNAKSSTYVLWFNWVEASNFANSYYAVATSKTPEGPFSLVVEKVTTLAFSDTGDFNILQDDDGSAYIIYTAHIQGYPETHQMSVEKLTDDYLSTLGNASTSGFFGQSFVEAPAIFKRNGVYYATFGSCCCYCLSGSPVSVYTATTPLGPWTQRNVLGGQTVSGGDCPKATTSRGSALLDALLGVDMGAETSGACLRSRDAISAQQTDIFEWIDSNGDPQFMYIGDRWQSAPDGLKAHDFTFWSPLNFTADGNITAMQDVSDFVINI
jgi:hypothetical protein